MELVEMRDRSSSSGMMMHGNISKIAVEHRELPVDVPDSFVGVVKTTPRYPPPHPSSSVHPRSSGQSLESDKLRRYAEEVRQKRSQEEMLRSSLRGSSTLQQLEQRRQRKSSLDVVDTIPSHSMINPAFEPDEDQTKGLLSHSHLDYCRKERSLALYLSRGRSIIERKHGFICLVLEVLEENDLSLINPCLCLFVSCPSFVTETVPSLPDLDAVITRLSVQLNGDVKSVLHHPRVTKYLSIYKKLMQNKETLTHIPHTSMPSPDMLKDVISLLEEVSITLYCFLFSDLSCSCFSRNKYCSLVCNYISCRSPPSTRKLLNCWRS